MRQVHFRTLFVVNGVTVCSCLLMRAFDNTICPHKLVPLGQDSPENTPFQCWCCAGLL